MTAFDYARVARTVLRMLTRFGADATLTHKADPSYDPSTGAATPTETTDTVKAAVFPYEAKMIDGTLVRQDDRQAFIAAITASGQVPLPKPGDTLTLESLARTVVSAKNLGPAGVYVLYELQVRA